MNDKAEDGDADARIGDVEGGKGIGESDMQIEKQEINDMAVEEAVGEVTENAGEEESKRYAAPGIGEFAPQ